MVCRTINKKGKMEWTFKIGECVDSRSAYLMKQLLWYLHGWNTRCFWVRDAYGCLALWYSWEEGCQAGVVSGLNHTHKMPMTETPVTLSFKLRVWWIIVYVMTLESKALFQRSFRKHLHRMWIWVGLIIDNAYHSELSKF